MSDAAATPTASPVGQSPGAYQLKPNGSRRTNTARVSPLTRPPPAYTANHDDADGVRPVQRERGGQDDTLPTYNESLDPETVPGYDANANANANDNDVEAGAAQQVPQRPRAVVHGRRRGYQQFAFVMAIVAGVFIYLLISHWSH